MNEGRIRVLTTYLAAKYVRDRGHKVDQAAIRRAAALGAIPWAEELPISATKTVWLVPSAGLDAWIEAGLPGRHHYQAEQFKSTRVTTDAAPAACCLLCAGPLADVLVNDWQPIGVKDGEVQYAWVRGKPVRQCQECGYPYQSVIEVSERIEQLVAEGRASTEAHLAVTFDPGPDPQVRSYYEQCRASTERLERGRE